MLRLFAIFHLVLVGFIGLANPAEAAIPIPCTATRFLVASEVRDAVDRSGHPIELRYHIFGCQNGKWDGYATMDGRYHKLTAEMLARLPQPPTFWAAMLANKTRFWVEWLWMLVGTFVVLGTMIVTIAGVAPSTGPTRPTRPASHPSTATGPRRASRLR